MTPADCLRQLEQMGTAQNRKVYSRHGVGENQFGVSFANLNKLAKTIKSDHALAQELWASGNHDARVLATMVADPAKADARLLKAWARDLDNYIVCDSFSGLVAKSPHAWKLLATWSASKGEWIGRAGWTTLARLAMSDEALAEDSLSEKLGVIEREIHTRKNRVRDAMLMALISIGLRSARLKAEALAAAARIGKVEVDHGQTNCKTPDATAYLNKAWNHKQAKLKRASKSSPSARAAASRAKKRK